MLQRILKKRYGSVNWIIFAQDRSKDWFDQRKQTE